MYKWNEGLTKRICFCCLREKKSVRNVQNLQIEISAKDNIQMSDNKSNTNKIVTAASDKVANTNDNSL